MSQIQTLILWDEAVRLCDQGDWRQGLAKFGQIEEKNSRVLYNVGCAHLILGNFQEALQHLNSALEKDSYMAVGYFQRAYVHAKCSRWCEAEADLKKCRENLRDKQSIDYKVMGMRSNLYLCDVLFNSAILSASMGSLSQCKQLLAEAKACQMDPRHACVEEALKTSNPSKLNWLTLPKGGIFTPPRDKIKNLPKAQYIQEAKVVSALKPDDKLTGFKGSLTVHSSSAPSSPRSQHKNHLAQSNSAGNSRANSPSPFSQTAQKNKDTKGLQERDIPPPPSKPVPRLPPNHPKHRPPPHEVLQLLLTTNGLGPPTKAQPLSKQALPQSGGKHAGDKWWTDTPSVVDKGNWILKKSDVDVPNPAEDRSGTIRDGLNILNINDSVPLPERPQKAVDSGISSKHVIPPPNYPAPGTKSKPLPELPSNAVSGATQKQPPAKRLSVPVREAPGIPVTVHFECNGSRQAQLPRGSDLSVLLAKGCQLHDLPTDSVDLWYKERGSDQVEPIRDNSQMQDIWQHLDGSTLQLWCYGKS